MKRTFLTLLALVVVVALIFGGVRAFHPFMDKQERVALMEVKQQVAFAAPGRGDHRVQIMIRESGPRNVVMYRGGHDRGHGVFGTFFKVLLFGALGYGIWRFLRRKKRDNDVLEFEATLPLDKPFPTRNSDLLDQWEEKTRRERNNKAQDTNTQDTNKEEN